MADENGKFIAMQLNVADIKYLSVRKLYFDWFFPTGAETATQLLDNIIKIYLSSINRTDLIKEIRNWKGNETHNIVRIIQLLIERLSLDFDFQKHNNVLENLYKLYSNRYLDSLNTIKEAHTILDDLNTIDYSYKYFRDRVLLDDNLREETIINKLFLKNQDIAWGVDKISLYNLFYRNNQHFVRNTV